MSIKARLLVCISFILALAALIGLAAVFFIQKYAYSSKGFIPQAEARSLILLFLLALVALLAVIIVVLGIMLHLTLKSVLKPLDGLVRMASEIKGGNLDYMEEYSSNDEFGKVFEEFDQMRLRLKQSLRDIEEGENLRREMVISVAHDLKTPVTSILGYSEGLLSGVANTPEKREKYMVTIMEKAKVVDKLVNDLYSFSKLDMAVEKFDMTCFPAGKGLYEMINQLYAFPQGFILNNRIHENISTIIKTDTLQLKRVIQNAVQNSMEHSGVTTPEITFLLNPGKNGVVLVVSDNGRGLNEDECVQIFDRFYRGDPSRGSGNSGLGLNISRRIIEEMGGKIWARPREGQSGLSLLIFLPEAKIHEKSAHH